ncbi:hypothetical protein VPH35_064602 [Triticum aestivum]
MATARWLVLSLLVSAAWASAAAAAHEKKWKAGAAVGGQVVEKERRRVVAEGEAGTVTATDVADAAGTVYRLQFITMDPGALFLPVQLHADAVFYVHSGRGKVTYIQEGGSETSSLEVQRGDVYNLEQGSILYIQSYPNATRERLRIYAIFTSNAINSDDPSHPTSEAYSSVSNLLRGFDVKILRQGFGVSAEVVEAIRSAKSPQSIITYNPDQKKEEKSNWTEEIFDALWGDESPLNKKKKKKDKHKKKKDKKDDKSKSETFNFYSGKPDVKNCFGWSKTMTNKDLQNLRGSNIGMFMVNLTTGSMMGPHWNPKATEIAIVTHGSGIVQVVCPSTASGAGGDRGHHDEGGRGGGDHGHHDEGGRRVGDHGHHDAGGRRGGDHGQEGVECKNSVFRRRREEEERQRREEKERKQREEEEAARREQEEEEERRRREEEEGGGGQGGGGGDDPREEEERRRREEEEGGGGQGGRGDDPREEEERRGRREEEEGGRGGRGGDDPWEEEEGDWGGSSRYRAATTNLKKRYHRGRKGAVFQSA